jgi:hypothetical protein
MWCIDGTLVSAAFRKDVYLLEFGAARSPKGSDDTTANVREGSVHLASLMVFAPAIGPCARGGP